MNPGVASSDILCAGVNVPVTGLKRIQAFPFQMNLDINGSLRLAFVPVGKTTTIELASTWNSPSFDGAFLPTSREVSTDGFKAQWKVLHLNRNYPQQWKGSQYDLNPSAFGVKLYIPADAYQKTMRTAKYALMFIAFTFLAFFFSEAKNRIRIHPFQYLLIGLALIIFYTLLLSIAEHLSFDAGYAIAGAATIGLVAAYAKAVLHSGRFATMVGGILAILYIYLYILMQVEDYALLLGSIGLFIILAGIMYLTRKIDWYRLGDAG